MLFFYFTFPKLAALLTRLLEKRFPDDQAGVARNIANVVAALLIFTALVGIIALIFFFSIRFAYPAIEELIPSGDTVA